MKYYKNDEGRVIATESQPNEGWNEITESQYDEMLFVDLEKRVNQYSTLSLPGQGMSIHMGTSYLINDLWREVRRLRVNHAPH